MGISPASLEFLLAARRQGLDLTTVLTLGRQGFHNMDGARLNAILTRFGVTADVDQLLRKDPAYDAAFAEPLFRALGAGVTRSLDISTFEGCTDVHDLNCELTPELEGRFTAVLDFGTVEHVWNFPRALENAMRMVAPNGSLLIVTPANNYCGHGLYQFSPELFFRVLTEQNGFRIAKMLIREERRNPIWYSVRDPESVGRRHGVVTTAPTELFVFAKRVASQLPRALSVYQSDYVARWEGRADASVQVPHGDAPALSGIGSLARRMLPTAMRDWLSDHVASPLAASRRLSTDPESFARVASLLTGYVDQADDESPQRAAGA